MSGSIEITDGEIAVAHTKFMKTLQFRGKRYLLDESIMVRVSSEVKQRSERSQSCHFSVVYVRVPGKLLVLIQCSKCSKFSVILI